MKWLTEIGYEKPPTDEYDPYVSYAARRYKKPNFYAKDKPAQVIALYKPPELGGRNGYLNASFELQNI